MLTDRTAASDNPGSEETIASGSVLRGRFVLEEQLEHGRLGVVFRATDRQRAREDGAGQPVEILILPAEIARNRAQLETFKREFVSVQALSHPNIVDLYDFDRDGETYYVVMELVDGESLRNVVDSLAPELLAENEALEVVRAVGEALLYAHASGVVHGDVRAENVLVTAHHEIKLLFASACLARSAPFSVDPRDDVYGLASLAYQLLSGEMPPATGLQGGRSGEPPRIRSLSRGRWNALRAGLAVRDKRSRSVRQFLAGIGVPERELAKQVRRPSPGSGVGGRILRRAGVAALVMGAVVAVVFTALQIGGKRLADVPALITSPGEPTGRPPAAESASDAAQVNADRASTEVAGAAVAAPDVEPAERGEFAATESDASRDAVADAADASAPPPIAVQRSDSGEESGAATSARAASPSVSETVPANADASDENAAQAPAATEGRPAEDISSPEQSNQVEGIAPPAPAAASIGGAAPAASAEIGAPEPPTIEPARPRADGTIAFARQELVVTEAQSVAAIEIRRPEGSGEMTAVWWTSDGTAVATDDYADFGRVVERFADGELSRTVFIPITSDALIEDREQFGVNLSALSADGSQQGELSTVTITIVDDD